MKITTLLSLLLLLLIVACNKEEEVVELPVEEKKIEDTTPLNHISAKINGKLLTIYQVDSLNPEPIEGSWLSFSFGRKIVTYLSDNTSDTSLFISGYYNKRQLSVDFPFIQDVKKFDIMREPLSRSSLKGFYCDQKNFKTDNGYINFSTNFYPKENLTAIKVGELEVTKLDWEKCQVGGTFKFVGYGYFNDWSPKDHTKVSILDSTINITEGTFYYQWEKDFDIKSSIIEDAQHPDIILKKEVFVPGIQESDIK